MYTNNRDAYREFFFTAWQKHEKNLPLDAIESQLVSIILQHPEYHGFLTRPDTFTHQEFALEENPFFHMSLHLAISEQIATNRPAGIVGIYQKLNTCYESHEAQHRMMEVLCKMMARSEESGTVPGDDVYLEMLRNLYS